jgi:hypothetical protein
LTSKLETNMTFKGSADVYFELEPSDTGSESDASLNWKSHDNEIKIANDIRVCDDQWAGKMCGPDADQFLSSIHKKKNKNTHSTVFSIDNFRNKRINENRDDSGSRNRYNVSQSSRDMMNDNIINNIININDQRDVDTNFGRTSIVKRNNEDENEVVDPIFSPVFSSNDNFVSNPRNNYYVSFIKSGESRTSAPRNNFYVSSTESSRSRTSAPRNSYYVSSTESSGDSSIGKQEIKRRQQPSGLDCRFRGVGPLDPSLSSATLILDDLVDMKVNIDSPLAEETIATSRDTNGKSSPLWKLLWERRWEWAQERVRLHPEEARKEIKLPIVSADITNEEDLQRIEESDDFHSALPLHLACAVRPLPPTAVLRDLIDAYPEACHRCQELSGMLPIHMAANLQPVVRFRKTSLGLRKKGEKEMSENFPTQTAEENAKVELSDNTMQQYKVDSPNHGEIIGLLLTSYPKSVLVRESINGMTPLHIAASTTRAENGIVSPVASNVLNILMVKGPADAVNFSKDKKGMTPHDWAWRNVDYFCPRCGMENATNNGFQKTELLLASKKSEVMCDYDAALLKLDAGVRCKCTQSLSVSERCLHPLLRKEIRSEANEDFIMSTPTRKPKSTALLSMKIKQSPPPNINCSQLSPLIGIGNEKQEVSGVHQKDVKSNIMSPRALDNIREYANNIYAREGEISSLKNTCKIDRLASDKIASLYMKIHLSELVHPSNHGRRRSLGINAKHSSVPNPYFEVFAAHRCGMSRSYYKSYPLRESTEGTWEDAFLDLGLTHKQLQNGTNGAGHIEIGIRVMHCPEKGSEIKVIGTCHVSLENLERQQQERLQLREEIRHLKDIIGGTREVDMTLPEPEKRPILKGFEVTGKLQVLSLTIK